MTNTLSKRRYVLDTNVLIGFALWLPIKLNGVFWAKLADALKAGQWVLLDVVVNEIKYNKDLSGWCKEQSKQNLIKRIEPRHRNRAVEINNTYKMIDQVTQKSTVDTYIISYAEAEKLVVFSRESNRKTPTDLYKIPDVCDLLRLEKIKNPERFIKEIGYKN